MKTRSLLLVCAVIAAAVNRPGMAQGSEGSDLAPAPAGTIELVRYQEEYSRVDLKATQRDSRAGLAVVFRGTEDLHFYAKSDTAPAPGFELKVRAASEAATFAEPLFPEWKLFYDPAQEKNIEVFVGDFEVFVPLEAHGPTRPVEVTVQITGLACTSSLCLPPFNKTLTATVDFDQGTVQALAETEPQKPLEAAQATSSAAPADSPAKGDRQLQAVLLDVSPETGRPEAIERICKNMDD